MITRLKLLLGRAINFLKRPTDRVQVQQLEVVQAVVQSVILVKVTAHEGGELDKARVNKGPGSVAEDDRLEFRNRKEECELDEVGNELEPARRKRKGGGN